MERSEALMTTSVADCQNVGLRPQNRAILDRMGRMMNIIEDPCLRTTHDLSALNLPAIDIHSLAEGIPVDVTGLR